MFIIEFIYTVFYLLLILVIILLAIALAIPLALLYFVYWILFKSWRKKSKNTIVSKGSKKVDGKSIRDLVSKSMRYKNSSDEAEADELKKEIDEIVKSVKESVGVEDEE